MRLYQFRIPSHSSILHQLKRCDALGVLSQQYYLVPSRASSDSSAVIAEYINRLHTVYRIPLRPNQVSASPRNLVVVLPPCSPSSASSFFQPAIDTLRIFRAKSSIHNLLRLSYLWEWAESSSPRPIGTWKHFSTPLSPIVGTWSFNHHSTITCVIGGFTRISLKLSLNR